MAAGSLLLFIFSMCQLICLLLLMLQVLTLSQTSGRSRSDEEDDPTQEEPSVAGSSHSSSKAPPTKKKKSTAVADTLRQYLTERDEEAQEVRSEVNILSFSLKLHEHPLHAIAIHLFFITMT